MGMHPCVFHGMPLANHRLGGSQAIARREAHGDAPMCVPWNAIGKPPPGGVPGNCAAGSSWGCTHVCSMECHWQTTAWGGPRQLRGGKLMGMHPCVFHGMPLANHRLGGSQAIARREAHGDAPMCVPWNAIGKPPPGGGPRQLRGGKLMVMHPCVFHGMPLAN